MKRVCLITGAGGRLGSALCAELLDSWNIVAVYHSHPPRLDSQLSMRVENILTYDPKVTLESSVHCIRADLSLQEDIRRLTEVAIARFGKVDAIVNSAADTRFHGFLTELSDGPATSQQQLLLNCIAPFQLVSAIHQASWKDTPFENARCNRSVVNISSQSALDITHDQGQAMYSASKAALNTLSVFLAMELAPYSVRVNALCPGRFTSDVPTGQVVKSIRRLLEGTATGTIDSGWT
jgi:NAD(P)-dependent dehydrogenase (short-subunit alcohol dehydrogenase family)